MPVYLANRFEDLTILRITGNDKVRAHLEHLGFIVGEKIMVVNMIDDDVIVKVKGVSLAISKELAKRILV